MIQTVTNVLAAIEPAAGKAWSFLYLPQLQCPTCLGEPTRSKMSPNWNCSGCGFRISEQGGIFRAMTAEREQHFRTFIREYSTVRSLEGRGSSSPEYYLALPYKDLSRENRWQWQIRARTFACLTRKVLPVIERSYLKGCDLLDIGAGNCWLSYRMARRGHRPVAVDLLDNDRDGLGAAKHYLPHLRAPFSRFLAEMDRLPFASAQFDVIVFNASFHYSVDYVETLREAVRCLRRPGFVVIADSPFYSCHESGNVMVREKHEAFEKKFGFRSDSISSLEFLTRSSLKRLEETFSLRWNIITPWYGLAWATRPWKARLLGRREPSRFHLVWGEVK